MNPPDFNNFNTLISIDRPDTPRPPPPYIESFSIELPTITTLENIPSGEVTAVPNPITSIVTPLPVAPRSKFPTFEHPYIFRPSRTTIRVLNRKTHRYDIYHVGQIAVYIVTDNRIRKGRFNPALTPSGYVEFVTEFNRSNLSSKRFATYDYATNTSYFEGEGINFNDFNIDLTTIGWKSLATNIPRPRQTLAQRRKQINSLLSELQVIDPRFSDTRWDFMDTILNIRKERESRGKKYSITEGCSSPLRKILEDDNDDSASSMSVI
ncbi:hypothetical protein GALMADRAFT_145398 [Galerina marginata CBS 339.88]|uniref:Uncharacterized protein n=1 Tax=Galerina marginata (strain CBS 339.88) TaxID=685588 RepID=A0A067SFF7_GALM3|nr:hypothetical protein GALMADRAFT_145398 [Galerina marginata CBS 339.88]